MTSDAKSSRLSSLNQIFTGAEPLAVPEALELTLLRAGSTLEGFPDEAQAIMANGFRTGQRRVVIHQEQVGEHRVTDVIALFTTRSGTTPWLDGEMATERVHVARVYPREATRETPKPVSIGLKILL